MNLLWDAYVCIIYHEIHSPQVSKQDDWQSRSSAARQLLARLKSSAAHLAAPDPDQVQVGGALSEAPPE